MIHDYLNQIKQVPSICEYFKKKVREDFFTVPGQASMKITYNQNFTYYPNYRIAGFDLLKALVELSEFIGISGLEQNKGFLQESIGFLSDSRKVNQWDMFESVLGNLSKLFADLAVQIQSNIAMLSKEERERLDEAFHCYLENCNYSSIVMSVSAIEFRLLKLMKKGNKTQKKLDDFTLGRLIKEYLDNKSDYDKIIPEKYEALLTFCNSYRILSAHPKQEKITHRAANFILGLSFEFLMDEKLKDKIT